MLFERGVISLEGFRKSNWRSRLRRRAHFFVVPALRGNAISMFFNTSAARACCACVFARLHFQAESRLMTPLMKYSWF